MKMLKFKIGFTKAKQDKEKLVLPGLIYCSAIEEPYQVHWLGFGWWHYALTLTIALEILKGASKRSSNVVENEQSREFCDKCGKDKYLNAYTPDEGLCMCKVPQQKS